MNTGIKLWIFNVNINEKIYIFFNFYSEKSQMGISIGFKLGVHCTVCTVHSIQISKIKHMKLWTLNVHTKQNWITKSFLNFFQNCENGYDVMAYAHCAPSSGYLQILRKKKIHSNEELWIQISIAVTQKKREELKIATSLTFSCEYWKLIILRFAMHNLFTFHQSFHFSIFSFVWIYSFRRLLMPR